MTTPDFIEAPESLSFHDDEIHIWKWTIDQAADSQTNVTKILARYLDCEASQVALATESNGKPYLKNSQLQFNLSHSKQCALLALTLKNRIGIDIQAVEGHKRASQIVERFFTADEKVNFAKLNAKAQAGLFIKLWTLKEAITKAYGERLLAFVHQVEIDFTDINDLKITSIKGSDKEAQKWSSRTIQIDTIYEASLVVESPHLSWEKAGFFSFV